MGLWIHLKDFIHNIRLLQLNLRRAFSVNIVVKSKQCCLMRVNMLLCSNRIKHFLISRIGSA